MRMRVLDIDLSCPVQIGNARGQGCRIRPSARVVEVSARTRLQHISVRRQNRRGCSEWEFRTVKA